MKQGGETSFSRMNQQSISFLGENEQFVGLLEKDLMTAMHKLR